VAVFRQALDIDDLPHADAATAEEHAHPGFLAGDVALRRQFPAFIAVPRAGAKSSPTAAAAAEASMVEVGMSLGAWKTPHTNTPGWLVLTGVKGEVWAKRVWGLSSTPRVSANCRPSAEVSRPTDRTTMSNCSVFISPCSVR
jgi:hypothetical protein